MILNVKISFTADIINANVMFYNLCVKENIVILTLIYEWMAYTSYLLG
jgi:hypothetical protein